MPESTSHLPIDLVLKAMQMHLRSNDPEVVISDQEQATAEEYRLLAEAIDQHPSLFNLEHPDLALIVEDLAERHDRVPDMEIPALVHRIVDDHVVAAEHPQLISLLENAMRQDLPA
jgi:hypothetical protein